MEKGTLSHLKNVFNQRSVTKNVAESFNYVADFIKFVTEGYVLLFVMDELNITSIDEVANVDDLETSLNKVADSIIDKLWKEPVIYTPINPESEVYPYCFCKQGKLINTHNLMLRYNYTATILQYLLFCWLSIDLLVAI